MVWMIIYIPQKIIDEITYPCPNLTETMSIEIASNIIYFYVSVIWI